MKNNVFITLLPVTLAVFIAFLTMGMQLPVLPLHLQQNLGMDTLAIGTVIGAQFVASLLTRSWAGNFADMRGAKRAVLAGLLVVASSGVIYLISLLFIDRPASSVAILLLGRVVLALGESLLATGALGWGLGLVGPANAGKVMAWIGIAIYGAWALGAPLGVAIYHGWHFTGIAMAIIVVPLLPLMFITQVRAVAPTSTKRTPFYKVMGAVWRPGLGLALASVGFGMITAFIALLFAARAWGNASLAFTAFGVAFIAARLFFAHLPDKLGGARVALVCVLIEACGQLLIWGADDATLVYLGAALTGFGYSLAFPAFGVEAVRRAPPHTRSLAMGAYVAFLDIALAITSPLAGALAAHRGVASVYLAGAIAVALAMLVALSLMARQPQPQAAME
ncbi:arabinose transporter [Pantoea dispersa]|uniref:arabinose transporter n=1 Tax=Pantoea dispersa TaxID=59814 RepID=UPI002DBC974E|nr:arabinose transporter [Pantoea dispersa]MEB5837618.1 arabinose transporter [Pantoea dispersa]